MTEEDIKAGLFAASQAAAAVYTESGCFLSQAIARAAVSAFLRAVPGDLALPFDDGSGHTYIFSYQLRMLADEVEGALRDATPPPC